MINWDYLVEQRLDYSEWLQQSQKKWKVGTGKEIYAEKEQELFSSPSCLIAVSASTHGSEFHGAGVIHADAWQTFV